MTANALDPRPDHKLLVRGVVKLDESNHESELERGMVVRAEDGAKTGVVAALVLNCHLKGITHVLMGYLPPTTVYRLIPLSLIARIDCEDIWLHATVAEVAGLPVHQPEA